MLMLTHTYLLQNILDMAGIKNYNPDIFVYNILPDLLTIHPDITSRQTHKIKRLLQIPPLYPKAAYVMFHLFVDDLAHYGFISPGIPDDFDPDSHGYTYIKGKPLISSILAFQKKVNKEISYNEAVYRSHLVVEMVYDLIISDYIKNNKTIELLANAVSITAKEKKDEFAATINWLYGLDDLEIFDVMKKALSYMTEERLKKTMNIEGRIRLYAYKFGLQNDEQLYFADMENIFLHASQLLDNDSIFLRETAEAVKKYGWFPPIM
ncbi:MAG: hypothetical protein HGB33_02490 [Syntrophaceae bacterium]|nr:hypothetical protein [Syntrophaceae bacterium]